MSVQVENGVVKGRTRRRIRPAGLGEDEASDRRVSPSGEQRGPATEGVAE